MVLIASFILIKQPFATISGRDLFYWFEINYNFSLFLPPSLPLPLSPLSYRIILYNNILHAKVSEREEKNIMQLKLQRQDVILFEHTWDNTGN